MIGPIIICMYRLQFTYNFYKNYTNGSVREFLMEFVMMDKDIDTKESEMFISQNVNISSSGIWLPKHRTLLINV